MRGILIIVSGFNEEESIKELQTALKLIDIQIPTGKLDTIRVQHQSYYDQNLTICSDVNWDEKGGEWWVHLMVNPTVRKVKESITNVCRRPYFIIYYGGHADESGNWILDDDDADDEESTFTCKTFCEIVVNVNSSGELYLNCCYSNEWEKTNCNRRSAASDQLRAGDSNSSSDNGSFHIYSVRCLYCYRDLVPIPQHLNSISSEIAKNAKWCLTASYIAPDFGTRNFTPLSAIEGNPPSHTAAVYVFLNNMSGDCFLITTKFGGCNILIDGIHYEHFREHWDNVIGKISILDLVIGTHVDDDHVGGIYGLFKSPAVRSRVQNLWLNAAVVPIRNNNAGETTKISGADVVEDLPPLTANSETSISTRSAATVKRIWDNVPDSVFYDDICSGRTKTFCESTTVKVLLPEKAKLDELRLKKDGHSTNELSIVTLVTYDYPQNNAPFKMLFTGDGSCDTIYAALLSEGLDLATYVFDLVTLPHHGSFKSNRSVVDGKWFHRKVKSKRYVLTGNRQRPNEKDTHPSQCLCNDLDEMLNVYDFEILLSHATYKHIAYFPKNHQSEKIVVTAVDCNYLRADIS